MMWDDQAPTCRRRETGTRVGRRVARAQEPQGWRHRLPSTRLGVGPGRVADGVQDGLAHDGVHLCLIHQVVLRQAIQPRLKVRQGQRVGGGSGHRGGGGGRWVRRLASRRWGMGGRVITAARQR